jgi:hypothetical protein
VAQELTKKNEARLSAQISFFMSEENLDKLNSIFYKTFLINCIFRFMIIRKYATNLIFFAQLAGRPATARQADDVPIAIGGSTGNASVY